MFSISAWRDRLGDPAVDLTFDQKRVELDADIVDGIVADDLDHAGAGAVHLLDLHVSRLERGEHAEVELSVVVPVPFDRQRVARKVEEAVSAGVGPTSRSRWSG